MGIKLMDIILPLLLNVAHFASSRDILPCNGSTLFSCGEKEICDTDKKECVCVADYTRVGDDCLHVTEESSNVFTTVVITILALVLMIGALVLVIRKYNLVEYVCRKVNLRNDNNIVYEDVMIGHDVRPITP